jgi:periplasmic copper chaperone A
VTRTSLGRAGLLAAVALAGAGCDSDRPVADPVESWAPTAPVTVRDPWVRAAATGATDVFGTLVNSSGRDVTVAAASTPLSPTELHGPTGPARGGLAVEAGGAHVLEPGGDRLVLTGLTAPVRTGDRLTVTLRLADGRTTTFTAVGRP